MRMKTFLIPLILGLWLLGGDAIAETKTFTECVKSKDPAISHYFSYHADPSDARQVKRHKRTDAVVVTWIRKSYALRYRVLSIGDTYSCYKTRDVYGWAMQGGHGEYFRKDRMSKLTEALKALPKSNADPAFEDTVLVSFARDGRWKTEIYNAHDIPSELKTLMHVLGERLVTKASKTQGKAASPEPLRDPNPWSEFSYDVF